MTRIVLGGILGLLGGGWAGLPAMENPNSSYLQQHHITPQRGTLTLGCGATIALPPGLVYFTGRDAWEYIGWDPALDRNESPPLGVILSEEDLEAASAEANPSGEVRRADSQSFSRSMDWSLIVSWQEGWVDPDLSEVYPAGLLKVLQLYARGYNRQLAKITSDELHFDGWLPEPKVDGKHGMVEFGLLARWQTGNPYRIKATAANTEYFLNHVHLAKQGSLELLIRGNLALRPRLEKTLKTIDERVKWRAGQGFHPERPEGVQALEGGVRTLIVPRLGGPVLDEPTTPLRFGWLLWAVPLAVVSMILWRKFRSLAAVPAGDASAPATAALARCPACGSPVAASQSRCGACGASLIRR